LGDQIASSISLLAENSSDYSMPGTIQLLPGRSEPLGPSSGGLAGEQGINFALAAPHATSVTLCLHDASGKLVAEAPMHHDGSTGVWNGFVPDLPPKGVLYGFRVGGEGGWETAFRWDVTRILLDPYARYVVGRAKFGVRDAFEEFEPEVGKRARLKNVLLRIRCCLVPSPAPRIFFVVPFFVVCFYHGSSFLFNFFSFLSHQYFYFYFFSRWEVVFWVHMTSPLTPLTGVGLRILGQPSPRKISLCWNYRFGASPPTHRLESLQPVVARLLAWPIKYHTCWSWASTLWNCCLCLNTMSLNFNASQILETI